MISLEASSLMVSTPNRRMLARIRATTAGHSAAECCRGLGSAWQRLQVRAKWADVASPAWGRLSGAIACIACDWRYARMLSRSSWVGTATCIPIPIPRRIIPPMPYM